MLAEPIRPPLVNSTTSQYKRYFAFGSHSPVNPYRDKAVFFPDLRRNAFSPRISLIDCQFNALSFAYCDRDHFQCSTVGRYCEKWVSDDIPCLHVRQSRRNFKFVHRQRHQQELLWLAKVLEIRRLAAQLMTDRKRQTGYFRLAWPIQTAEGQLRRNCIVCRFNLASRRAYHRQASTSTAAIKRTVSGRISFSLVSHSASCRA